MAKGESPWKQVMNERGISESKLRDFINNTPRDSLVEIKLKYLAPRVQGSAQSFFGKYVAASGRALENPCSATLFFKKFDPVEGSVDYDIETQHLSELIVYGPKIKYSPEED